MRRAVLIVRDLERRRRYCKMLGGKVVLEGPPVIVKFYNPWLILSTEVDPPTVH
jgi:hypothetical protein